MRLRWFSRVSFIPAHPCLRFGGGGLCLHAVFPAEQTRYVFALRVYEFGGGCSH